MKPTSQLVPSLALLALLASAALAQEPATEQDAAPAVVVEDAALAPWRRELLDLAFEAASEFPTRPHVKNRCRAQFEVVETCFELDQPHLARAFSERIDDWRKGVGLARFVAYCAERGDRSDSVRALLGDARRVADASGDEREDGQAWRKDRVLASIEVARYLLGELESTSAVTAAVLSKSEDKLDLLLANAADGGEDLLRELEALSDDLKGDGDFDLTTGLLELLADVYGRVYAERERRLHLEENIRGAWQKLPLAIRMDLLVDLARAAAEHGDLETFERLRTEARGHLEGATWKPVSHVELVARWAALRHLAGQDEEAVADLREALDFFAEQRDAMPNIDRADALRPVAEAYHALGRDEAAAEIYRRALDESLVNPNSRPRCDDLVATCCSMARTGFEPEGELRAKLREVRKHLRAPW